LPLPQPTTHIWWEGCGGCCCECCARRSFVDRRSLSLVPLPPPLSIGHVLCVHTNSSICFLEAYPASSILGILLNQQLPIFLDSFHVPVGPPRGFNSRLFNSQVPPLGHALSLIMHRPSPRTPLLTSFLFWLFVGQLVLPLTYTHSNIHTHTHLLTRLLRPLCSSSQKRVC
jgi:hypothetical protein